MRQAQSDNGSQPDRQESDAGLLLKVLGEECLPWVYVVFVETPLFLMGIAWAVLLTVFIYQWYEKSLAGLEACDWWLFAGTMLLGLLWLVLMYLRRRFVKGRRKKLLM